MRMRSMHWRLQQETKWTVSCGGLNTNTDLQRLIFTWFLTDKEITRLLLRHLLSKTLYIKTYNGGCLFLGQVCHTSLEGIVPLTNSIFCRKCLFLFFSPWKCNEQTWVAFVNEKLGPTSVRIFCSHCLWLFGSFRDKKIPLWFLEDLGIPLPKLEHW